MSISTDITNHAAKYFATITDHNNQLSGRAATFLGRSGNTLTWFVSRAETVSEDPYGQYTEDLTFSTDLSGFPLPPAPPSLEIEEQGATYYLCWNPSTQEMALVSSPFDTNQYTARGWNFRPTSFVELVG